MKAMVFAAGLGTRLRPLTNDRPKALVEIDGQPLLAIVLQRLQRAGFTEVVVNVHHFADKVIQCLEDADYFGLDLHISDERELLLDTGGGLLKARSWLSDEPFLVHNVDILSDLDLAALYHAHTASDALATLAVRHRETSRYLQFDTTGQLVGWRNARTGEVKTARRTTVVEDLAFSGIYMISPVLFDHFPTDETVFSSIDVFLKAARTERILAYPHDDTAWLDVGKPEALEKASALLKQMNR